MKPVALLISFENSIIEKIICKNLWYVIEVLALMNKGRVGQTNSVE